MDSRIVFQHLSFMKIFFSVLAAILLLSSCAEPPTIITDLSPDFMGRMTVVYEGDDFVQDGISVKVEISQEMDFVEIMLEKVKFVPAMPLRIDVTILEIPIISDEDGIISFKADGLIPWAMGGPYDTYRVDSLEGTLTEDTVSFSMDFFNTKKNEGYPTSYSGSR